eukprot:7089304-Lingulodinium_polyedra.AAC.1
MLLQRSFNASAMLLQRYTAMLLQCSCKTTAMLLPRTPKRLTCDGNAIATALQRYCVATAT